MKKNLLILFFTAITFIANAQKEFDNWFFGINNGLSFLSGAPLIVTGGALSTNEGCASISTSAGSLLFYTDGVKVYNRIHQQMQNGYGLNGGYSSSQSAIIIPDPADSNLYYIFTAAAFGGVYGICYSKVDMTLQAGFGNVTLKNYQLVAPSHEKLTAVKHSSGNGYWVIAHDLISTSTAYYAYPVTSSGVGLPVISSVGLQDTSGNPYAGCMKVSPDGTKLVNPLYALHKVEISDFDASTGIVSNPFIFVSGTNNPVYGTAFSETGNVLYLTTYSPNSCKLFQLNMAAGSPSAIIASAIIIYNTSYEHGSLQLASDHKIYLPHHNSHYLGIINDPDSLGILCNYVDTSLYMPNIVTYGLQNSISGGVQLTSVEQLSSNEQDFIIYPIPVDDFLSYEQSASNKSILTITDITGKNVLVQHLNSYSGNIDVSKLTQGYYFAVFKAASGKVSVHKLIVNH